MYEVLKYCRSWNDRVPLSNGARDELLFWKDSVANSMGNQFGLAQVLQEWHTLMLIAQVLVGM